MVAPVRTKATTGWILAALVPASAASAGQLVGEQIFFDDAGNALPGDKVTLRLYYNLPSAEDQVVGVVGTPTNPMNVMFSGATFFDSDHFLAGDRPPEFGLLGMPGFEELSYDSWFTIGNTSLDVGPDWPSGASFEDQVIIAPGTSFDAEGESTWDGGPGGPDNVAWTVPPTLEDPGGGGVQLTPQSVAGNWDGNRVALMQLTLVPDDDGGGIGTWVSFGVLVVIDGVPSEEEAFFEFPAPGPLAVLALAGLAGLGRRRREAACGGA